MPVDKKWWTRRWTSRNLCCRPACPSFASRHDYTDSTGEPALRVLLVLDESVDVEHFSGQDVGELKWEIRESLRKHGITLFPYIFLAKQSELDEVDNEEP